MGRKNYKCPFYSQCLTEWVFKDIRPTCDVCVYKDLEEEANYEFVMVLKLWAAVLKRAIKDYFSWYRSGDMSNFKEVYNWFMSDDMYIGSFRYICELLRLPVEKIRKYLIEFDQKVYDLCEGEKEREAWKKEEELHFVVSER